MGQTFAYLTSPSNTLTSPLVMLEGGVKMLDKQRPQTPIKFFDF